MAFQREGYNGNSNLRDTYEEVPMTDEQVMEYAKCAASIEYFLRNYAKIVSLDDGIVKFNPFPYQLRITKALKTNRKVLVKLFRQSGKSTIVAGYVAWYMLFNKDPKTVAILANKLSTAREIFSRVQMIVELCPKWMQHNIYSWNKTSFEFANGENNSKGSKCFCAATSPSAVRGQSINLLVLDEFAFMNAALADEFIASVFPTISSSPNSQIVIVSTPKGMNHYYKLWVEAEQGLNGFVAIEGKWTEHPKRDQAWADEQLAILGDVKYAQEIGCSFIGSSNTLVRGEIISQIPLAKAIAEAHDGFCAFYEPDKTRMYCLINDPSEGLGKDFSAFSIIDITELPYKVAATYKNNAVHPLILPEVVYHYAKLYNDAFVLIETNSIGQQIANALFYDFEYDNMYMSTPTKEDIVDGAGGNLIPGAKTTKKTKAIGCSTLKLMVENGNLEVNDHRIIDEMSTFVQRGSTYKAEDTKHDDLMMTLVNFAYLTTTTAFKNLFDYSLREKFINAQMKMIEDNQLPLGFFTGNLKDDPDGFIF